MGQEQSQMDVQEVEKKGNGGAGENRQKISSSETPKQKAKLEDIVVVKDTPDAPKSNIDETVVKLKRLRVTYPIIRNVAGIPVEGLNSIPGLNADPMTEMLLRYQYHLTECAEAVAFDQNTLSKRIREVESFSAKVMKTATERQRQMDQSLGVIQKFFEIDPLIERIGKNMDKTIELMQNLNKLLPKNERFLPGELDVRSNCKTLLVN